MATPLYLVWTGRYDDMDVIGVFDDKAMAQELVNRYNINRVEHDDDRARIEIGWNLNEYAVARGRLI